MVNYVKFDAAIREFDGLIERELNLPHDFHRAGIWGNGGEESAGFTQMHQVHGHARGGWQWDDRRATYERFSAAQGLSPDTVKASILFLIHELKTTESRSLALLKKTTTLEAATYTFMSKFERPGVPAFSVRLRWAQRALQVITGLSKEKPMPDTTTDTTTDTTVVDFIKAQRIPVDNAIKQVLMAKGVPGPLIDIGFNLLHQIDLQTAAGLIQHVDLKGVVTHLKGNGVQLPSFQDIFKHLTNPGA